MWIMARSIPLITLHGFADVWEPILTSLYRGRPQGRGKQEKFFRFVDQSFVPEAYDLIEQGKIQTLADLNRFFTAWLEVAYHQKVHNSFKQRPIDRYQKDDHPIRTLPPHELAEVFLLEETRKVDKTGCISLLGHSYEVETVLAGQHVQVRFDPYDLSEIQVWKDGTRYENATSVEAPGSETTPSESAGNEAHSAVYRTELCRTALCGASSSNPSKTKATS